MKNDGVAMLRRDILKAAGAGLAIGLFEGAAAQAQTLAFDPANSVGPATSWFNGKLYALWKDSGNDGELSYASFDGSTWSAPARIPKVASSAAPSLATFQNKLYAAWKGKGADQRIWFAAFDGSQWSAQAQIPGATTGGGPALSVFDRKLYAVWRGADDAFSSASFDGSTWSSRLNAPAAPSPANPPIVANSRPFSPQMIASTALSGVDQGKYGDCVFEASVVATATTPRGQVALSRAIMQNADGSYTVTFAGDPKNRVKVTPSDLTTTHVHDNATWAEVVEAAI